MDVAMNCHLETMNYYSCKPQNPLFPLENKSSYNRGQYEMEDLILHEIWYDNLFLLFLTCFQKKLVKTINNYQIKKEKKNISFFFIFLNKKNDCLVNDIDRG
jgi:hypothetical protein